MGFEDDSDIEDDDDMIAALLPPLGKAKLSSDEDVLLSSFKDDKVSTMSHISMALNRAPHSGGRSK